MVMSMGDEEKPKPKSLKGFASWPKDKLRAAQSLGGRSVTKSKRAFYDRETAQRAGRAGAKVRWGTSYLMNDKEKDDE